MKNLLLKIESKQVKTSQKVEHKLLWYNSSTRKIEEFYGGKLSFNYDLTRHKMVPVVEDVYSTVYKSSDNRSQILDWIKTNYKFAKMSEVQPVPSEISIEVDDEDFKFVEDSLGLAGIRYDWETIEE
jgi:hypothetical protein